MRFLRWLSWAAVAVPGILLLCHEWFGPDIWYHLYLGGQVARTLTAQPPDRLLLHQPDFLNLYWLFQLVVRAAFGLGGIPAVSLLFLALWAAILAVWLRTAGVLRIGAIGPWLALAVILVCQVRFEPRPEIFSSTSSSPSRSAGWRSGNWTGPRPYPAERSAGFAAV